MPKNIKVTIGTPHNGDFTPEYINSLMGMTFHSFTIKGISIRLHLFEGCYVHQARNKIASVCLDDYLLFIDTDMAFPVDGLNKLIEANKDIVGGLYYSRKSPNLPLVYEKVKGKYQNIEEIPNKLFEVDAVATGFMLIKKKVLDGFDKAIKAKKYRLPFDFLTTEETGSLATIWLSAIDPKNLDLKYGATQQYLWGMWEKKS